MLDEKSIMKQFSVIGDDGKRKRYKFKIKKNTDPNNSDPNNPNNPDPNTPTDPNTPNNETLIPEPEKPTPREEKKKEDASGNPSNPSNSSNSSNSSKRIVTFNDRESSERELVKYISYDQFLKQEAENIGKTVIKGRFVDPKSRKVDDGNLCEEAILGRRYNYDDYIKIPVPLHGLNKIEKEKAKKIILDFIREHQPSRELMPLIAKNALERIEEKARLLARDDFNGTIKIKRVDLFTAVGTPLDFYFGVDGWIEIETDDEHTEIITFDLKTGNYEKFPKDLQADLIMGIKTDYAEIAKQSKREFKISEKTVEELGRFVKGVMKIYKERLEIMGF